MPATPSGPRRDAGRLALTALAVAICYYLGARLGLALSFPPAFIAALWPPNAILLCALLASPRRHWWLLLLATVPAELAADLPAGMPLAMALGYSLSDWVEVLIAATLVQRLLGRTPSFERLRELAAFILACAMVGPLVAAFPGAVVTGLAGSSATYAERWRTWVMGDALTHLTLTPCLLVLLAGRRHLAAASRPRIAEASGLVLTLAALCWVAFAGTPAGLLAVPALLFAPLPALLWSAVRFGPRGTYTATALVTVFTVASAVAGRGPFVDPDPMVGVLNLQVFLLVSLTPIMFLATLFAERRSAEERTRASEESYRNLVELAPVPVFVHRQGRCVYLNPEAVRLLGVERAEEVTRQPLDAFLHPEDRERFAGTGDAAGDPPASAGAVELRLVRPDGGSREVELTELPITFAGDPGRLAICVDRTERRKAARERAELEDRLQRTRRMEALGLLAGGVAHDLNNILSGILSYPELLLLDLPEHHPMRQPLETIRSAGERAAAVVADMLTIARGVAGPREVLSLNTVVEGHLRTPEHRALRNRFPSVRLHADLDPNLLPVTGSPVHLAKVLMNLVTNAMEAIAATGDVTVTTGNRYLESGGTGQGPPPGEYAALCVADNGPGIPAADLERVFEPFYSRKHLGRSGTGLGLTVVWNTVRDHGGHVEAASGPDGTRFEVLLPVTRDAPDEAGMETPLEGLRGHGQHLLVVDDEPSQREIASAILRELGYEVSTAASGVEAVATVRETDVDLVVLDMIMEPGMGGLETWARMVAHRPGLRAVIASGFSESEEVRQAQLLGAGPYLRKPYTVRQLGALVKAELGRWAGNPGSGPS